MCTFQENFLALDCSIYIEEYQLEIKKQEYNVCLKRNCICYLPDNKAAHKSEQYWPSVVSVVTIDVING